MIDWNTKNLLDTMAMAENVTFFINSKPCDDDDVPVVCEEFVLQDDEDHQYLAIFEEGASGYCPIEELDPSWITVKDHTTHLTTTLEMWWNEKAV